MCSVYSIKASDLNSSKKWTNLLTEQIRELESYMKNKLFPVLFISCFFLWYIFSFTFWTKNEFAYWTKLELVNELNKKMN